MTQKQNKLTEKAFRSLVLRKFPKIRRSAANQRKYRTSEQLQTERRTTSGKRFHIATTGCSQQGC